MALSCKAPALSARAGLHGSSLRARTFMAAPRVARRQQQAVVEQDTAFEVSKLLSLSTVASSWLMAGNAHAAAELSQIAAGDARTTILASLFVPALGWVAFNMLTPLSNQLKKMDAIKEASNPSATATKRATKKRGVAAAAGLGAALSMLAAENADAATELAQLADGDARTTILASLFVPALGWVAFNMLTPLSNQLKKMDAIKEASNPSATATKRATKKRAVAAGLGMGAALSLFAAQSAQAATEVAQLADGDARTTILASLFVPALGWVAFNMLTPLSNQLKKMDAIKEASNPSASATKRATKKRSLAAGLGMGAALSLFAAQNAEAATELAQLADGDARTTILASLFVPALGWVAFNMLTPLSNQLKKMDAIKEASNPSATATKRATKKRSLAAGLGMGAALSLFAAQSAQAATEVAQLADGDARTTILASLFVPALGWVAFNMLTPLSNQLKKMDAIKEASNPSASATKKATKRR